MADLTITLANLFPLDAAFLRVGVCGEIISAAAPVWFNPATGLWMNADADHASVLARVPTALAMNNTTAIGQPFTMAPAGCEVNFGAIFAIGVVYYNSKNAGRIAPYADISAARAVIIGEARTTSILRLIFADSGGNAP